jgi:hypothetical protein
MQTDFSLLLDHSHFTSGMLIRDQPRHTETEDSAANYHDTQDDL